MFRKIFDSPWLYFGLAGLLLTVGLYSQIQFYPPGRPIGTIEDLETLDERDHLNVVFIVIDMLRSDRLSAYGSPRQTSPIMDQLASKGIRFANVEAQSSWTKASMASMWTAMYPERTGIQRFFHAMPQEAMMPAEIFKAAGYRTAGVWRNGWVASNFGFPAGAPLVGWAAATACPNSRSRLSRPLASSDPVDSNMIVASKNCEGRSGLRSQPESGCEGPGLGGRRTPEETSVHGAPVSPERSRAFSPGGSG